MDQQSHSTIHIIEMNRTYTQDAVESEGQSKLKHFVDCCGAEYKKVPYMYVTTTLILMYIYKGSYS